MAWSKTTSHSSDLEPSNAPTPSFPYYQTQGNISKVLPPKTEVLSLLKLVH